jgi:hypothetical protein
MVLHNGLGKLVSMTEQDLGCSIDNLYGEWESRFLEAIGANLSKEWKEVGKEQLYEAG